MHGAARTIAACFGKVQGFHHDALTGKRCITMYEHRQHLFVAICTTALLTRAHTALDDRVHDFKVRRVKRERQMHGTAARGQVA